MNDISRRRLPAEWEATEAVLMAWPHPQSDWEAILEDAEACFGAIARAIAPYARVIVLGPDIERIGRLLADIPAGRLVTVPYLGNDTWTRDYGPITVETADGMLPLDFRFNGWGLKFAADRDNLATRHIDSLGLFRHSPANCLGFVLEGGSVESDGQGLVLTTDSCLMSPNRNGGMGREEILEAVKNYLGAERVVSLANGELAGDDTDGHIDTLARLLPPGDVIAYTGCADPSDEHYASLKAMADELRAMRTPSGNPYHLLELPLPDAVYDPDDGHRLPATYANFLIVNNAIILPVYGQPLKDRMAADILSAACPEHVVVPVDCSVLISQHGSLHCSTMQLPANTLAI